MYEKIEKKPHIRCSSMFQIHCVDSNEYWIDQFKKKLQKFPKLNEMIHITFSKVTIGTFNDRLSLCNLYSFKNFSLLG